MAEFAIKDAPKDGISAVKFSRNGASLLATSWDNTVRVYDVAGNKVTTSYEHMAPVLDGAFVTNTSLVSGGLDQQIRYHDFTDAGAARNVVLGHHDAPVRCLDYSSAHGFVISGSWDKTVKCWDVRAPGDAVASGVAPDKVYSMALCGENNVLVATAGRRVELWDIRKMAGGKAAAAAAGGGGAAAGADAAAGGKGGATIFSRESFLKHQTRAVRPFTDGTGYITGSIEGRCSVEFVDPAEQAAKRYAFRCHRFKIPGTDTERVFPVNAVAFHPVYGSFVTGGGDGTVVSWDWRNKKKLAVVRPESATGISSLAFNNDGTQLAIAVSYTWEQGEREHPADAIYIRAVADDVIKPKGA